MEAHKASGQQTLTSSAQVADKKPLDNTVLWDAANGKMTNVRLQHGGEVISAEFSPDGQRAVTASRDKTARLWDAESGKAIGEPLQRLLQRSSARTANGW